MTVCRVDFAECGVLNARVLQNRGFFDHPAFRKARQIQEGRIDQVSLPEQNQIRKDFSGGRRVHYAVAAEAVG